MKPRTLESSILKAVKTFPAVVLTGPRQSGKTTLLKMLFKKKYRFVSLEDPDTKMRAKTDPRSFLEINSPPVVLDEIQYVPELLSYIKTKIDNNRKPGQWLFTGSQNFVLMQGVSQSLAGRAAVLSLLPFSCAERNNNGKANSEISALLKNLHRLKKTAKQPSLTKYLLRGFYPEIASNAAIDRYLWCSSYLATYVERDVRNLTQIGDLSQFESFLKLCAVRSGQILNLTNMSQDIGISVTTAKRWLSVLEAAYMVYLLYPYYKNIGKRLIKSPKLYFNDTGLVTYLLGLHDKETLLKSPHFGHVFETMVVTDFLKRFLHFGQMPSMYYMRTRDSLEIDLVLEVNQKLYLFEIKSSATIFPKHAESLIRIKKELGQMVAGAALISRADQNFILGKGVMNYNWADILCS